MTHLSSFAPGVHAVIIGASGGIGAAFADLLDADPQAALVTRLSRATGFDLTDPASITAAAAALATPPDLVIVATGLLHAEGLAPERDLRQLSADSLCPRLRHQCHRPGAGGAGVRAAAAQGPQDRLCRPVGARRLDFGQPARRLARLSRVKGRAQPDHCAPSPSNRRARTPHSIVLGLHPGTVDTGLSKPFQRNVKTLFTPAQSAAHLLGVIDAATPAQSGLLLDWSGAVIPY